MEPSTTIGAYIFNENNEILLLKSPKWHNKWVIVCGHVEFGEKLTDAVTREVKEETNLEVKKIEFLRVFDMIHSKEFHDENRHFVCHNFTCKALPGEIKLNEEASEYCWVKPEAALTMDVESATLESLKYYLKKRAISVGVGIMVLKNGKVLLGQRNPNKEKASSKLDGQGTWTMPGGKMNYGESVIGCAKRETKEETGMDLKDLKVICVNNDLGKSAHFITLGLLCVDPEDEPKAMEPETILVWRWFDLNELPSPMYFPSQRLIDAYKEKRFFNAAYK